MIRSRVPALLTLFATAAFALPAFADVPPPDGYVETCSVAEKEQPGTKCATCDGFGPEPDKCKMQFQGTPYHYVCKTWGATVYTEVWCDGTPKAEETPAAAEDDGCALKNLGGGGAGGAFAAAFVAAMMGLIRRRQR